MQPFSAIDAGQALADAIARRDFAAAGDLLDPEVEFRALTPRRAWAPESHAEAVEVLRTWFGDCEVEEVMVVDSDPVGDRCHIRYRFRGHRPDGPFVIEQQAYYDERDGRITWIRVLCSGFRTP